MVALPFNNKGSKTKDEDGPKDGILISLRQLLPV
jgi:hypothetical protein